MNKAMVAGLAAGVLVVGLIFSPLFSGITSYLSPAQAQSTGNTKHFTLVASEKVLQVAPDSDLHPGGVMYNAMVFNGSIPAPVLAVHQGDKVEITLVNEGKVIHSLDFHAAVTTTGANSGPVKAGENKTWSFDAVNAGAFFYHCSGDGLNGVWEHIANGMYGAVVIHPHNEKPAKEFYVVFGQVYTDNVNGLGAVNGTGSFDMGKFWNKEPDLVLTNGMSHKYAPAVGGVAKIVLNKPLNDELTAALGGNGTLKDFFLVHPGEQTRWYIVNAGPNDYVAFHFIGAQMDVRDGSIINRYGTQDKNDETWTIPPGSASVIEAVFPAGGPNGSPGVYVGVDHEMTDVVKGAAFAVIALDAEPAMAHDQPEGTAVPPRGSESAGMSMNMTQTSQANSNETLTSPTTNNTSSTNSTSTGNQTSGNTTSTGGGSTVKASIVSGASTKSNDAFSPNPIQAKVGDTVTWTNNDSQPHTVTSGTDGKADGKFNSSPDTTPPFINAGQTFSHKFTEAGDYPYFCELHPNMVGKVSVS